MTNTKTILVAGSFAVAVLALFVGLILLTGKSVFKAQAQAAPGEKLVPPLESLIREHESEKTQENKYHAKSEPPKIKIFQTDYKGGTQVTFNHAEHVGTYKLGCIECHHVERCSKCHLKNESHTLEVAKGKQAMHENCIGCHADNEKGPQTCDDCHKQ